MIILTRHYLTQANVDKKIQTYTDNPILKIPYEVEEKWLKKLPSKFDPTKARIWVSELKRTRQTSNELVGHPYMVSSYLNELPLPAHEGEPCITDASPWKMTRELERQIKFTQNNVARFWGNLNTDRDHLVFCHGITMRILYHHVMNIPLPEKFPDIFKIEVAPLSMMVFNKFKKNGSCKCKMIKVIEDTIQYEEK